MRRNVSSASLQLHDRHKHKHTLRDAKGRRKSAPPIVLEDVPSVVARRIVCPWSYSEEWRIERAGTVPGTLRGPSSVCCVKDGGVAVCEEKNSRVQIFDRDGLPEVVIDKETDKKFRYPGGVCSGMGGALLLVTNGTEVCFYNTKGKFLEHIVVNDKSHGSLKAVDMMEKHERIVVSSTGNKPEVHVRDMKGKNVHTLKGNFLQPNYVSTDARRGLTAVSDCEMGTVQLFDFNGKRCGILGKDGPGLTWPTGIAFNERGNLLVVDQGEHAVSEYATDGRYIHDVLTSQDGLKNPLDVAVDSSGRLCVCSQWFDFHKSKYCLQVFDPNSGRSLWGNAAATRA